MIKQIQHDDGITEVVFKGVVGAEEWRAYKQLILDHLDASDSLQYILTDLSGIEEVDNSIISEFGSAPHLTHDKLGFLVLLGGNAFQQFITKITEGNALRKNRAAKLRVHFERETALDWLHQRQEIDQHHSNS